MAAKQRPLSADHPVVIAFLVLATIAFLWFAAEVLKPLALAVLLSFALAPASRFFERRGLPRILAVVLTVLLALGALGFIGYKVGEQLTTLAADIDKEKLESNIRRKFHFLRPRQEGALEKLSRIGADLVTTVEPASKGGKAVAVNVVAQPTFTERLKTAVGPYLEYLGIASFVLILVLFMLATREDLRDRIIRLFGTRRVSLTTRSMDEVGQRISRYLTMFATVNSTLGLIIGLGLWAIGVPLGILWGVLVALFRFIPYVGAATAFVLPFLFTIATFPGWREPILVLVLFATVETLANSFFEPVIYGKTTGVSALGLLVAAMFWTWLWGGLGLLLSTPLTVCLAVLGKSVRGLEFFAILLVEGDPLEPDVRFYQRLLAMDQDGAATIVEDALKEAPRAEVFDQILVPTLTRAERDAGHGELEESDHAYIRRFIGDLIDDLEETPEVDLKSLSSPATSGNRDDAATFRILGVAAQDRSDALVLRMLALLLEPAGFLLTVLEEAQSPLEQAERIAELAPSLLVLSYLPPDGLTTARYLVRRLRARFADLPVLVGRWAEHGATEGAAERLTEVGASQVVFTLADARDEILKRLQPDAVAAGAARSRAMAPLPDPV